MAGEFTWRQDDLLRGGGDPNAMLELLRGDSPSLGVNEDTSVGSPSMARPGNYDVGRQNLTANRLLYSDAQAVEGSQAKLDAAKKVFSSDDFGIDQATKSLLTGSPMPTNPEDQKRLAPLDQSLKDQAKKLLDANVWNQFNPQMLAASGYGEPGSQTDATIEQWKSDNNLKLGASYRALQDLGMEYPGTGKTAPVFQSDAPGKAVGIGKAVPATTAQATGAVDKTGLTPVIASEFGEVDNPARGGYTEANWNVGAWGDNIGGKDAKFAALPISKLKEYGNPNDPKFQQNFNSNYDIQVYDPKTGKATVVALGDKGPGASTGAGLDLTYGARASLGLPEGFKGGLQMRIVKKGSALPDGSTSATSTATDASSPTTATAAAANPAAVYIQPLNPRELKDPAIYGDKNSTEDNLKWARHQTDLYATEMAHAGTPIDTEEYKTHFDSFYGATKSKVEGKEPAALPTADLDRFSTLTGSLTQMDSLLEAKKKAGGGGMMIPNNDVADFKAKRDLLLGIVAKGLGGNVGSLSDSDVKRVQSMLPNEWDSPEESERKIAYVKDLTKQQMESTIRLRRSGHYDTSGLEKEYFKVYPALDQARQNQANSSAGASIDKKAPSPKPVPQQQQQPQQNAPLTGKPIPQHHMGMPVSSASNGSQNLAAGDWWKKLKIG